MTIEKRMSLIGRKVHHHRMARGLSLSQLATKLGVARVTIWNIENKTNTSCTFKILVALQDELQIKDLFDYDNDKQENPADTFADTKN